MLEHPLPGGYYSGYRFASRSGDEQRASEGFIPVLIAADGKPCPGARFFAEPISINDDTPLSRNVVVHGTFDHEVEIEGESTLRADSRGVVWWKPDALHNAWRLQASFRGRSESDSWYRVYVGGFEVLEAYARHSIALLRLDLPPLRTWTLRLEASDRGCNLSVPIFLGRAFAEGGDVLFRVDSTKVEHPIPEFPFELEGRDREPRTLWAGFDRSNPVQVPHGESLRDYEILLRESGCIEIELRDGEGKRLRDPRAVYLEESDSSRAQGWAESGLSGSMSMVAQGGSVHFTGVPIGKRWRVGAYLFGGDLPVSMELVGPRSADETIFSCLNAHDESRVIHGVLSDPNGAPAADQDLVLDGWNSSLPAVRFATDLQGEFSLRLPNLMLDADGRVTIRSARWQGYYPRYLSVLGATLRESSVRLQFPVDDRELFATGRILDAAGNSSSDATILVSENVMAPAQVSDGQFFIRRPWPRQSSLKLRAATWWHCPTTAEQVVEGRQDVILRVELGARIVGRLDSGFLHRHLGWRVTSQSDHPANEVSPHFDWGPWQDGIFEIGPIPADATEVTLDFGPAGRAVLRDLKLQAGKIYRYPEPVRPQE